METTIRLTGVQRPSVRFLYLVLEVSQSVAQFLCIPLILKETKVQVVQVVEEVIKGVKVLGNKESQT
jgi:hypothetical protein